MTRNCCCPRCGTIEPNAIAGPVQCKHCGEIFQPPHEAQAADPGVKNWWTDPAAAPAAPCLVPAAPSDPPAQAADSGGEKWWKDAPPVAAAPVPVAAHAVSPFAADVPAADNNLALSAADRTMLCLGTALTGVGLIGLLVLFPCLVISGNVAAVALLMSGLIGAGLIVGALRQRMAYAAVIGGAVVAMLVAGIVFAGRSGGQSARPWDAGAGAVVISTPVPIAAPAIETPTSAPAVVPLRTIPVVTVKSAVPPRVSPPTIPGAIVRSAVPPNVTPPTIPVVTVKPVVPSRSPSPKETT